MHATDPIRNAPGTPILRVDGVTKSYRRGFLGRRGAPAVRDLTLSVRRGEIYALLGHNGAGKTTTLKAVLGLVRPDGGRITIDGVDARRPDARLGVSYLPENPTFHENLTARELLDFYGRLLGLDRQQRREQGAACLERVGMADHANRRLARCSKGMRQRVGLAQALLGDPRLLILDEPQSGLDPLGRRLVRDLLESLRREGRTVVFSSHIVPDVAAVADRVATLREGRLVEVRDLGERPAARAFQLVVAAPPADAPAALCDGQHVAVRRRDPGRWTLNITHPAALARTLDACAELGLAVHDLGTDVGDVEAAVLAGMTGPTAAAEAVREVAPC
jgi:ABC-2 type transport system ATP-binding protein